MGITERREREKEARRNTIIDAAEEIFFSKGVDHSSMDEVAAKAELSKGTLYLYFKNKNELYHGIVHRGLVILLNMFQKIADGSGTGFEKIKAIGNAYFEFSEKYPNYALAMLHHEKKAFNPEILEDSHNIAQCNKEGNKIFETIANIITKGMKDGSMSPTLDPLKLSMVLWAHASGVMNLIQMKGDLLEHISGVEKASLMKYSLQIMERYLVNNGA